MRISAVQNVYHQPLSIVKQKTTEQHNNPFKYNNISLSHYNITFGAIKNADGLRALIKYGIPDMYDGKMTIPPSLFDNLLTSGVFQYPARYSVKFLKIFEDSFSEIPYQVFQQVKKRAKTHPDDDLQEIFIGLAKTNEKRLRAKQIPIFNEIIALSEELPYKQQGAFEELMYRTYQQLHGELIDSPFNKFNFQYKLSKIRDDIEEIKSPRTASIVSKMITESEKLSDTNNAGNRAAQKAIIYNIADIAQSSSYLRNYEPLQQLIHLSLNSLDKEKILIPFSRKSFISDLEKILETVRNKKLKNKMLSKAEELPTSKDSVYAYILKYQDCTPDKIAFRLAHLRYSSIEHRKPRSKGGKDSMKNYAVASIEQNSARSNIDYTEQMKRRPKTAENNQKQLDRFIELANRGKFKKHKVDIKFIKDYKQSTAQESRGQIILDTSKLKENK